MTRLLVSVRSRQEAAIALQAGVGLIDLKEPASGALAPTSTATWHEVAEQVDQRLPLSAALGELFEPTVDALLPQPANSSNDHGRMAAGKRSTATVASRDMTSRTSPVSGGDFGPRVNEETLRRTMLVPSSFSFAKVGLSSARLRSSTWQQSWQRWRNQLPAGVLPVLVHYADASRCLAPTVDETLSALSECEPGAVLIDTYFKDGGHVFQAMSLADIDAIFTAARRHRIQTVLGGSLTQSLLDQAIARQPDWIAVRGAACGTSRQSDLDENRLRELMMRFPQTDEA